MNEITRLLSAYPKHYATVPLASDGRAKRRAFREVSDFTRRVIFSAPYDFQTAVITGTNGKGSTGAVLSTLVRESGHSVGVISSPAMRDDCTDMIKVNGIPITPENLLTKLKSAEDKLSAFKGNPSLTHYMLLCVAAYDHFREQRVDVVVAETAIGGLYDPTVPFKPDLCVFTNITDEHRDVLGDTLGKAARHKARVIGPASRVVLGEGVTDEVRNAIAPYAARRNAFVVRVDIEELTATGLICDTERIKFSGNDCANYQHANIRLAAEAFGSLRLSQQKVIGIDLDHAPVDLFPENRFEIKQRNGVTYLFDSAHNKDSYLKLHESLQARYEPEDLIFFKGASTQDSLDDFLSILHPEKVTFVSGYHSRVIAQDGFVDLKDIDFDAYEKMANNRVIVICGIFLAPKVKEILFPVRQAPSRDPSNAGQIDIPRRLEI